jgi:hypothetical protein
LSEIKGRIWKGTAAKDEAITEWCRRLSEGRNRVALHTDRPDALCVVVRDLILIPVNSDFTPFFTHKI